MAGGAGSCDASAPKWHSSRARHLLPERPAPLGEHSAKPAAGTVLELMLRMPAHSPAKEGKSSGGGR